MSYFTSHLLFSLYISKCSYVASKKIVLENSFPFNHESGDLDPTHSFNFHLSLSLRCAEEILFSYFSPGIAFLVTKAPENSFVRE